MNDLNKRTAKSLRLTLDGRACDVLPDGVDGRTYPMPSFYDDLKAVAAMEVPKFGGDIQANSYIRRCRNKFRIMDARRQALLGIKDHSAQVERSKRDFDKRLKKHRAEAKAQAEQAVEEVRIVVEREVASLAKLFELGRQGILEQMEAHLAGQEWQGEQISSAAFRQCFQMVAQAIKGLGLPDPERKKTEQFLMQEVASALRETQETLAASKTDRPAEDKPN